jgi:hypothetical protein
MGDETSATLDVTQTQTEVRQEASNEQNVSLEEFKKLQDNLKKFQTNFDRVNTEKVKLQKDLDAEKKKTLSEKQVKEIEEQELKAKLESQAKELENKELLFNKTRMIFEKQWNTKFLDIVAGNDLETFEKNVTDLQAEIKKIVTETVNQKLKEANPIPTATSRQTTIEEIFTMEEIKKNSAEKGVQWAKDNNEKIKKSLQYWQTH